MQAWRSRLRPAAVRGARRAAAAADQWAERAWELVRWWLPQGPGIGELTAVVGRMGQRGFHEYAVGQAVGHFGRRTFLPVERREAAAEIRRRFPAEAEATLAVAERLLGGQFDLLGSGPVDMRRGLRGAGWRLDWHRDPLSAQRFNRLASHWRWRPDAMQPAPHADVKGPWELGRCQHLPTLALAWWLTDDLRFADCVARTIGDFRRQNPPGCGVQWACPMDVGLRVVSWIAAASMCQGARALTPLWWRGFLKSLVQHGRFLAANLEYGTAGAELITSNHHLANLLGLYWLALGFPHLDAAVVWRGIATRGLEQEIHRQVLPDGGNYESSVPYHRLDLEMLLSAYALGRVHQVPLSESYRRRLLDGLRFVAALRQPAGRMPQVGDADNGRAHILTGYGRWRQESMDHLLAAAAAVLDCPELAEGLDDAAHVEAILWGCPPRPAPCRSAPARRRADRFPNAGLVVARAGDSYLLFANGPVGTSGFGNHKHNDQLAVEWVVGRQPLVVDAGSYLYTSNPAARNALRSVAAHNTVSVDGLEQHTLRPEWLFRLLGEGAAETRLVLADDGAAGLWGRHTAYGRLDPPLVHTRRLLVEPDGLVILDDLFEGAAGRALRWQWLVYPRVAVDFDPPGVVLTGPQGQGRLVADEGLRFTTAPAWYSPGYGQRLRTTAITAVRRDGPARVTLLLAPAGCPLPALAEAADRADRFWQSQPGRAAAWAA